MTDDETLSIWTGEHVRRKLRRDRTGRPFYLGIVRGRPGLHIGLALAYAVGCCTPDRFILAMVQRIEKLPKRWGPLRLGGLDRRPIGPVL